MGEREEWERAEMWRAKANRYAWAFAAVEKLADRPQRIVSTPEGVTEYVDVKRLREALKAGLPDDAR